MIEFYVGGITATAGYVCLEIKRGMGAEVEELARLRPELFWPLLALNGSVLASVADCALAPLERGAMSAGKPCQSCGHPEPECRKLWISQRVCCPDCSHGVGCLRPRCYFRVTFSRTPVQLALPGHSPRTLDLEPLLRGEVLSAMASLCGTSGAADSGARVWEPRLGWSAPLGPPRAPSEVPPLGGTEPVGEPRSGSGGARRG